MKNRMIGYIISLAGLAVIAISFLAKNILPTAIKQQYIILIGFAAIVVGIVLVMGKSERQLEQVPIYEGHGKNRVIVGYQKLRK